MTLIATSASAFDPAHLKRLKDTNECVVCDLSDANLTSANLSGANLTSADLTIALLIKTNLRFARMKGVILSNTGLAGRMIYSGC